ncbi:hypothetical protein [Enterobacter kobei]|uniref:hypothetical protein n=1 Tax=Enterobacter kobei TaxID=208224 RepID=UPI003CEFC5F7
MDSFAGKFTAEYSQKRLDNIRKALAENNARREKEVREKHQTEQQKQPQPVEEMQPENTAETESKKKKWGLF